MHKLELCTAAMHWSAVDAAELPNSVPIPRRSRLSLTETMHEHLLVGGEGTPVVVSDAQRGWRAPSLWTFEWFERHYGDSELIANDLAPLRVDDNPPMQTVQCSLRQFTGYLASGRSHPLAARERGQPFYGNSWCPFNDHPELCGHIARPYFVQDSMPEDTAESRRMSNNFTKIFLGPAQTVTRLHCDTFFTHAWLSQIHGRKQFILYPPSQAHLLYAVDVGNGGMNSSFDPLAPDFERFPRARDATPYVAVCGPGDTILVPCCWFHHARALSPSITLMRNFVNDVNVDRFFGVYLEKQQQQQEETPQKEETRHVPAEQPQKLQQQPRGAVPPPKPPPPPPLVPQPTKTPTPQRPAPLAQPPSSSTTTTQQPRRVHRQPRGCRQDWRPHKRAL